MGEQSDFIDPELHAWGGAVLNLMTLLDTQLENIPFFYRETIKSNPLYQTFLELKRRGEELL